MHHSGGGNITELDLENKNISSVGAAALARALASHDSPGGSKLRVLRLARNPLGLDGLSSLLLRGETLQLCMIHTLDLRQIGASGLGRERALHQTLQRLSELAGEHNLRELVLDDNALGKAGVCCRLAS